MNSVNHDQADVLVLPEEGGEAARRQVELDCVHAWEHEQALEYIADEVGLIVGNLLFSSIRSKNSVKLVFVVDMADFFIEFPGTELTLNV